MRQQTNHHCPDNGLSPGRRQAIIWTNVGILLIWPVGTYFSEISIDIQTFSLKKKHFKVSSGKWRPFCFGLSVLNDRHLQQILSVRYSKLLPGNYGNPLRAQLDGQVTNMCLFQLNSIINIFQMSGIHISVVCHFHSLIEKITGLLISCHVGFISKKER